MAVKACGVIVANSAASPALTVISRSPSESRTRPVRTKIQSWPGWTRCCTWLFVGSIRVFSATVAPPGRLNIHVVRPPVRLGVGRMTTSSSVLTSSSVSSPTWSPAASGIRTSRLIVRLPVSIRLMVEGLRLVRAPRSSSERPSVVRRLRRRVRTTCSMLLRSVIRDSLQILQGVWHKPADDSTVAV